MKHFIWLSYDLGIKGNYQSLYEWLDSRGAKECGDSVACFSCEHKTSDPWADLKQELSEKVDLDTKNNRIYVVARVDKKLTGKFIFGRRRSAPWVGAAATDDQSEDVG